MDSRATSLGTRLLQLEGEPLLMRGAVLPGLLATQPNLVLVAALPGFPTQCLCPQGPPGFHCVGGGGQGLLCCHHEHRGTRGQQKALKTPWWQPLSPSPPRALGPSTVQEVHTPPPDIRAPHMRGMETVNPRTALTE